MRLSVVIALCILLAGQTGCSLLGSKRPDLVRTERLLSLSRLGEEYYQQGKLEDAGYVFQEILKMDPEHEDALFRLGNIAFAAGEIDESERLFNKVLAVNASNERAVYNLALIHMAKAEQLLKDFKKIVRPDFDLAQVDLMMTYIRRFGQGRLISKEEDRGELLKNLVEIMEDGKR